MPESLIDLVGLQVGAEDFLVAVLETTAQPIWVVDPHGVIRFANPAAIAALGYDSADELFGRHSHETIHHSRPDGTHYPAADCPMLLPRVTGKTITSELDWFFRRDGSMFPVSYVSAPLDMRDGRGAVVAFTDIEDRRRAERQLRDRDGALAAQQATLRRVAALVAGGAASAEVFAAVAREVASLLDLHAVAVSRYEPDGTVTVLGAWSDWPQPFETGTRWPLDGQTIAARVKQTGGRARVDYAELPGAIAEAARAHGIRWGAGAPIVVDGRVWGAMATWVRDREPLLDGIEDRLAELTALIAAAFSNTASRDEVARLADEQAALRRVATLVARQSSPAEVLGAVTDEVARLFGTAVGMLRFEPDGTASLVAQSRTPWDPPPLGTRFSLEGKHVVSAVLRTGRASRLDDWTHASGAVAAMAQSLGIRSTVGSPIVVEGRLWGTMITASNETEPQPADTESRLGQFTELVATAIAKAEARGALSRLAEEQAALRRVATLVAEESPPAQLFAKVAEEVASLLGSNIDSAILRYEGDEAATVVAVWGEQPAGGIRVGARLPVDGTNVTAQVFRERRSVRVDDYLAVDGAIADHAQEHGIRSAVGCPILVQGRLWGAMIVAHCEAEAFPPDTERRVAQFTELMATAIANTEARTEVQRLAEEQAALRRVATLVAEGAAPTDVFDAVVVEVAQLLGAAQVGLMRFEGPDEITILAHRGQDPALVQAGMRLPLDGDSVTARVRRSGRSARVNLYEERSGTIAAIAQGSQVNMTVGAPIVVEGALWGVMTASWTGEDLPPSDAEERLAEFAELVDTAIANADSRDQLMASRARVLTAGDEARRRVVRDLHDGAQQRLVNTIVTLKLARRALSDDGQQAEALLSEALAQAEQGNAELRELVHGILPSVLTRGGLRAAVESLVARLHLLVEVDVTSRRLASEVEASAYFIVAEALTNVVKHAQATCAEVTAAVDNGTLRVAVRDDGSGGADPEGHGLRGIGDRVAALGGRLRIDSSRGAGTRLTAELPLAGGPPGEGLRSAPSNAEGRRA